MDKSKRELREEKRRLKQQGNQKVRRAARRILAADPEQARDITDDFGRLSTADRNGRDRDPTRRRQDDAS